MEYLDFLDKNEPLDSAGLISDDDGRAISLPSDGGLEISDTEGESEAKSSDWKSLTTSVTMAMTRCAFLGGARGGRDVRGVWRRGRHRERGERVRGARRSVGRGVGGGRGRAQGRGRGLGGGNAVDGSPTNVGSNDAQPLTLDVVNLGASEPRESILLREFGAHFP